MLVPPCTRHLPPRRRRRPGRGGSRRWLIGLRAAGIAALLAAGAVARADGPTSPTDDRIDVNSATAAELAERLPGIGPVKARALVAYRQAHGPFTSPGSLVEVRGIGPRTLERLRPLLTLGAALERRHREAERRTREALARIVARARKR